MACRSGVRKQNVKHEIDHHAGRGDIEPDGKGPACNGLVTVIVATEGLRKRGDGKGRHRDGKDCVCNQNRKIDYPRDPLSGKSNATNVIVINQIGDKEEGGRDEGGDHKCAV